MLTAYSLPNVLQIEDTTAGGKDSRSISHQVEGGTEKKKRGRPKKKLLVKEVAQNKQRTRETE